MKLDLELLKASVSGMMMKCKDANMKKALKKHANTIDLMIEGQTLLIDGVVVPKGTLKTFQDLPEETKKYRKSGDAIVWKNK